jgi:hypothetical protein
MTFTLLRQTPRGWTVVRRNATGVFPSKDAALDWLRRTSAAWAIASEWRIIPTADLPAYEPVA